MMSELQSHIDTISKAIDTWLQPDNFDLKTAIEETVDNGFFSFPDVQHQIRVLKSTLSKKGLKIWAEKSGLIHNSLRGKEILCLHAGNIPLVGIQDVLAVVLTGGNYHGKVSKKDPFLLPTLIKQFEEFGLMNTNQWTLNLQDFTRNRMDGVLFAGSESSASDVLKELSSMELRDDKTELLMRTAHFSMALIENNNPQTMQDLTEAVFRYGGTGCRSVAIVVAPFHLNDEKCGFTDYVESFWLRNPQHQKPEESLFYRYAYNKALDIPQAWLNDFLIEENYSYPKEKFLLYWVKGGKNTLSKLAGTYRKGLQTIYSTSEHIGKNINGFRIEPLSQAQAPPIWWKPDQIDTIKWLQKKVADH